MQDMATIRAPEDDALHQNAERVLAALEDVDGRGTTTDIRKRTGLTPQTVRHHALVLVEEGYVERAGSRDVGAPLEANVYRLTDEGREAAAGVGEIVAPDELVAELEALRADHEELKRKYETFRDTVKEEL